jgi:DNA polymerase (family 10)
MKHPAVNVIGHLLGRRVGKRPGIEIDVDAVLTAAELTGTAIEINSHLDRLDAPVEVLWQAKGRDVHFIISTDSHRTGELQQSRWGVRQAQRGWVDKAMIANTWPAERFIAWAGESRAAAGA